MHQNKYVSHQERDVFSFSFFGKKRFDVSSGLDFCVVLSSIEKYCSTKSLFELEN